MARADVVFLHLLWDLFGAICSGVPGSSQLLIRGDGGDEGADGANEGAEAVDDGVEGAQDGVSNGSFGEGWGPFGLSPVGAPAQLICGAQGAFGKD